MPDAARSSDYFLNASTGVFKDNTSNAITPQMLRDFTVSAYQPQLVNPGGRLTLTTLTPVTTTDVTGATTIYYTPFIHNVIGVFDGTSWKQYTFSELSLALGTLTSGKNYDVFVYDNAGTLTLKLGPAWSTDTARGTGAGTTELVLQDGVYVNNVSITSGPGAKAGRYLGTIRTTSTTTTEDSFGGASQSGGKRFVWNAYNRIIRHAAVIDTTNSWNYTTATWRQANGATGNKVEYVYGLNIETVTAQVTHQASNSPSAVDVATGIGVDATNANSAKVFGNVGQTPMSNRASLQADYRGFPGLGYHYLAWLEISAASGTSTWYGDNGSTFFQTGLQAQFKG